jgi:hypothetical protein
MALEPETLLARRALALALRERGFPVAEATLATKATRGGGPPYSRFGNRVLYRWGTALAWAEARLTPPAPTAAEATALQALAYLNPHPDATHVEGGCRQQKIASETTHARFSEDASVQAEGREGMQRQTLAAGSHRHCA